jgi:hypothetical protein
MARIKWHGTEKGRVKGRQPVALYRLTALVRSKALDPAERRNM